MVTGVPPFYSDDEVELKSLIKLGDYSDQYPYFQKSASPELQSLIAQCLSVDVDQRINSDGLLQNEWLLKAN